MTDKLMTVNKIHRHVWKTDGEFIRLVRNVDGITLQLRRKNDTTQVALTWDEAAVLSRMLVGEQPASRMRKLGDITDEELMRMHAVTVHTEEE